MLLVNNIALSWHTPAEFQHAAWDGGIHFADVVFPWFLLMVGIAIPYAWTSHRRKGWGRGHYLGRALARAAGLFALGCLIDSSIGKRFIFDLDVLQLIGLAYLVGAAIAMALPTQLRLLVAAIFLLAHWAVIRLVHVPGMVTGTFEPTHNVIAYVNLHFLGRFHLAGLISVVPASALVLIGTALGDVLRRERLAPQKRLQILVVSGVILTALGWLWSLTLPFNKPVWTGSYIVFNAGLGALVLAVMFALLDVPRGGKLPWRGWALPFLVFGSNAIVAYVVPILVKLWILQVADWPGTHIHVQPQMLHLLVHRWGVIGGGWAYTLGYIGFWWLVLLVLYRCRIFLRV
jgi:predicted acyltransferase